MSGYTKLFGSILDSTVWELPHATVRVWVTMMAMADRHGEIQAAIPGLAHRARVTLEETETALAAFMAPDKYSRTPDQDGRRIEAIDGGWRLINHRKYTQMMSEEDRKERGAERQRRYVSNRQQPSATVSGVSSDRNDDTQTEIQTQTQTKIETDPEQILAPLGVPELPAEFLAVWAGTGKRGAREAAFKAWKRRARPTWAVLAPTWAAYMLSDRPAAGFVRDLSSWLNQGCHLQEWQPARAPPRNGSTYQQTIESMQGFLERHEGEE